MSVTRRVYDRMPDQVQPVLERGYAMGQPLLRKGQYIADPRLSWQQWKKHLQATETFADEFFARREEYEAYREEFFDGRIEDIIGRAMGEVGQSDWVYDSHRIFDAHQDVCAKLYAYIRTHEPETIVETGVHSGVSTASMLLGLEKNGTGTLYSLDPGTEIVSADGESDVCYSEARFYHRDRPSCTEPGSHAPPEGKSTGWIIPEDLEDRWERTYGRSRQKLPSLLSEAGPVDLFLHDSEHSTAGMMFEFELAWEWLDDSGLLVSHHIDHNDAFRTFVSERNCTADLLSFEPDRYADRPEVYDDPCSCGFAVKD